MEQRIVLSSSRTGSQALVAALSDGQTRPVEHVHFMGHRTLDEKAAEFAGQTLPAMLRTAVRLRSAAREPGAKPRVAVCVGDPMARQISHLFKFPTVAMAASGIDVYADPERAGAWMVETFHRRRPLTWLEEHVCEPFGVDLFAVPIAVADRGEAAAYGEVYRNFLSSFRPPQSLLDEIYGSAMMRHFYSDAERRGMWDRWAGTDAPAQPGSIDGRDRLTR